MSTTRVPLPTADEVRNRVHRMWGSVADSWGAHAAQVEQRSEVVTRLMLDAVRPAPGDDVLELAVARAASAWPSPTWSLPVGGSFSPTWRRRW